MSDDRLSPFAQGAFGLPKIPPFDPVLAYTGSKEAFLRAKSTRDRLHSLIAKGTDQMTSDRLSWLRLLAAAAQQAMERHAGEAVYNLPQDEEAI